MSDFCKPLFSFSNSTKQQAIALTVEERSLQNDNL